MTTSPIKRAHEQTLNSPRTEPYQSNNELGEDAADIELFYRVLNHYRITCNLFDQGKPGNLDQDEYVYKNCRSLFDSLDRFFLKCDRYIDQNPSQKSVFSERIFDSFGSFFGPIREFVASLPGADDFRISNFFYQNADPPGSTFNRLINRYLMESRLARAVRCRKTYFIDVLNKLVEDDRLSRIAVTSLGCGSALEMCEFISGTNNSQRCIFHCVDSSREALFFLNRNIARMQGHQPITMFDYPLDIFNLDTTLNETIMFKRSRLIYCSGLAESLNVTQMRSLIRFGYDHLDIGGQLVVAATTEFGIYKSVLKLIGIENFACWSANELIQIAHDIVPEADIQIETELEQTNRYLWITKNAY